MGTRIQTSTHRSTASFSPSASRSPSCRRGTAHPRCAHTSTRSTSVSLDALYLEILGDFFWHAFNGSGVDNFYDAGSCIDGRLTSAWNWRSSLEKKQYFHVFLLTYASAFLLFALFPCSLSWWNLTDSMVSGRHILRVHVPVIRRDGRLVDSCRAFQCHHHTSYDLMLDPAHTRSLSDYIQNRSKKRKEKHF